jgi:PPOX class probable F420-dependent enzyme
MIDWTTRFGRHVNRRFERESIVWLTTTDRQGRPQPRPVWFHWNGVDCLLFSQPQAAKIGHIRLHPWVSLNLNTDPSGDEVAVLLGRARLLRRLPDARRIEAYVRKYGRGLRDLGFTRQSFFEEYCVGIRVDPRQLRGF